MLNLTYMDHKQILPQREIQLVIEHGVKQAASPPPGKPVVLHTSFRSAEQEVKVAVSNGLDKFILVSSDISEYEVIFSSICIKCV